MINLPKAFSNFISKIKGSNSVPSVVKDDKTDEDRIIAAVQSGNKKSVKEIIKQNPDIVNSIHEDAKYSILQIAIIERKTDIIKLLVKAGANVNHTDYNGRTPLHFAAHYFGSAKVVKTLLKAGAEFSADKRGATPADYLPNKTLKKFNELLEEYKESLTGNSKEVVEAESSDLTFAGKERRGYHYKSYKPSLDTIKEGRESDFSFQSVESDLDQKSSTPVPESSYRDIIEDKEYVPLDINDEIPFDLADCTSSKAIEFKSRYVSEL